MCERTLADRVAGRRYRTCAWNVYLPAWPFFRTRTGGQRGGTSAGWCRPRTARGLTWPVPELPSILLAPGRAVSTYGIAITVKYQRSYALTYRPLAPRHGPAPPDHRSTPCCWC